MREWKKLSSPNGRLAGLGCDEQLFVFAIDAIADGQPAVFRSALVDRLSGLSALMTRAVYRVTGRTQLTFRLGDALCRVDPFAQTLEWRDGDVGRYTAAHRDLCACEAHQLLFSGLLAYRDALRRNRKVIALLDRAASSWVNVADSRANPLFQPGRNPSYRIAGILELPADWGGVALVRLAILEIALDGSGGMLYHPHYGPDFVDGRKIAFPASDLVLHYLFKTDRLYTGRYPVYKADSDEGEFALSHLLEHGVLLDPNLKPIRRGPAADVEFCWVPNDDGTQQILDCYCRDANDRIGELMFSRANAWFLSEDPLQLYCLPDPHGGVAFSLRVGRISHRQAALSQEAAQRLGELGIPLPPRVLDAPAVDVSPHVLLSVGADGEQLVGTVAAWVDGEGIDLVPSESVHWRTPDGATVATTRKGLARLVPADPSWNPATVVQELETFGVRVVPVAELGDSPPLLAGEAAAKISNQVAVLKRRLPRPMPVLMRGLPDAEWRFEDSSALSLAMLPDGTEAFWSIGVALDVGSEHVELPDLVESLVSDPGFMSLMRSDDGDVLWNVALADGRRIQMPVRAFAELLRPVMEWVGSLSTAPKHRRMTRVQAAVLAESFGLRSAPTLASLRSALRAVMDAASRPLEASPPGFTGELRHYQQIGVHWLNSLASGGFGGVLADDMGLGKTVQVIAHIAAQRAADPRIPPCLIVAPKTVLLNWKPEFERFAPGLKVLLLDGFARDPLFPRIPEHDVVLTHYALLPRDREALRQHRFSLVVLDEAQMVKNHATLAAKTLRLLDASRFLPVTGTPLENHLSELWTHLSLAVPSLMPELKQFRSIYELPITHGSAPDRLANLKRMIAPFILRRTKNQVAAELPPKTETIEWVELPDSTRRLYEVMRAAQRASALEAVRSMTAGQAQVLILTALMRLRQVCCDARLCADALPTGHRLPPETPKLDALVSLLQKGLEDERRILVFTSFAEMVHLIANRLIREGIPYTAMTGQTRDRASVLDAFRRGDANVLVMTTQTGGVGLNLTEADTVVHYDPWWNPAREAQATDRVHRIGQDKPVFVHKLVCAQTIEDRIVVAQQAKSQLARSILDDGALLADERKLADLIDLLGANESTDRDP